MTYIFKYKIYLLLSFAMILLDQLFSNDPELTVFIFATILLIGGLPHGALDFFILKNIFKTKIFISSLIIYLFIAAFFYILFFLFPEIIFLIFLIYSAFHFGDSDFKDESQISKLGWGSIIICIPLLVDINNAEWFLNIFLNNLITLNSSYLIAIIFLSSIFCFSSRKNMLLKSLLICVYLITCLFSSIFYGFAAYFAGLHSVHHFKEWRSNINNDSMIGLVLITGVSVLVVFFQFRFKVLPYPGFLVGMNEEILYNVIILLGSLTVPHMILINRAESLKKN
jgi:Brp/Blh family beta-carotene 15,15'-monooxygenase